MHKNNNQCVVDTLRENVDVEGHLTFIESLLHKYAWNNDRRKILGSELGLIRQKQYDTHLYLAVVGEFTSGKSTLINALIRDNILKTDVWQATTAAATVIEYNEKLDVEVTYINGTIKTYRNEISFLKKIWRSIFTTDEEAVKDETRQYIHKVTADEEIAQTIQKVRIIHPSEVLKNGLVIIDTPGADVNNPRHEKVTKKAIRELADAALIVISADKPVSQAIINFINNNLQDIISKCIFVVTKMDLLRPKERERLLEYIRQRLQTEFKIKQVNVFPYSPLLILKNTLMLNGNESTTSVEDAMTIVETSYQTERRIFSILKEQRIVIQLQKLVILIRQIFGDLETDLRNFEKTYTERHAALDKNRIKDIAVFVKEQMKKHSNAIYEDAVPIQMEVIELVNITKERLLAQIKKEIYSMESESKLKQFVKQRLDAIISNTQTALSAEMANLFDEFREIGQKQKGIFEADFKNLYISLATLGGNIRVDERKLGNETSSMISQAFSQEVAAVKSVVSSDTAKEAWTSLGSAGAGATIGTLIFPGIGTAVGFIVGGIAGLFFGPSLEEQQNKYFAEISKAVAESFSKSSQSIEDSMQNLIDRIVSDMGGIIDNYFRQYDRLVKEMIRRDEEEKQELVKRSRMIKEDLDQLFNRQQSLEGVRKSLNEIGRLAK